MTNNDYELVQTTLLSELDRLYDESGDTGHFSKEYWAKLDAFMIALNILEGQIDE